MSTVVGLLCHVHTLSVVIDASCCCCWRWWGWWWHEWRRPCWSSSKACHQSAPPFFILFAAAVLRYLPRHVTTPYLLSQDVCLSVRLETQNTRHKNKFTREINLFLVQSILRSSKEYSLVMTLFDSRHSGPLGHFNFWLRARFTNVDQISVQLN